MKQGEEINREKNVRVVCFDLPPPRLSLSRRVSAAAIDQFPSYRITIVSKRSLVNLSGSNPRHPAGSSPPAVPASVPASAGSLWGSPVSHCGLQ